MSSTMPATAEVALQADHLGIVWQVLQAHLPGVPVRDFGSRAGGLGKPYSDLDLALMTEQPLTLEQWADLQEAFSASDLPFRVDLVDWASTEAGFRAVIERQARALPQCSRQPTAPA